MRDAVSAFVAIGANLGDAVAAVRGAITALGAVPQTRVLRSSSAWRTAPVDSSGPDYINAVCELETRLTAPELLAQMQVIEDAAGRERPYRNAPRTLDLDLLLYGSGSIDSAALQVPHPRTHERAFVLVPLAEIAPQRVDARMLAAVQSQRIERLAIPLPPG